jgi:cysteinyl-tRNA synthetase
MALILHNTLTRQRELFEPENPERVTMYVCGPTVYNFAHIGNARPPVVFDVLARLLRRTYQLIYVRNVTDVDDKINAAAENEGIEINELTSRYLAAYHEDMAFLGVFPPDIEPKVTEHIPEIISLIERLIKTGHAYVAEGHALFSVTSFESYGALSGRDQEELIAGARVEIAPYKQNPSDFVLWKPSHKNGVGWASPWGYGRPGWHVECSAMVEAHLGETIDIHGGGLDLVFPHHENEAAQSTCAHGGQEYCRYWVHNGLINVESEKMSKSLGNVLLLKDLLMEAPGEVVRLGLLTAHYRQPLDWSSEVLVDAQQKLDRMYGALREAGISGAQLSQSNVLPPLTVVEALEDDLNTPKALAELFNLAREINREADAKKRQKLAEVMRAGGWFLGLLQADPELWFIEARSSDVLDEQAINSLVSNRESARKAGNFSEADLIRDELRRKGITIEDSSKGSRWRRTR